eukprot:7387875-Prymnesium_polylepis.1
MCYATVAHTSARAVIPDRDGVEVGEEMVRGLHRREVLEEVSRQVRPVLAQQPFPRVMRGDLEREPRHRLEGLGEQLASRNGLPQLEGQLGLGLCQLHLVGRVDIIVGSGQAEGRHSRLCLSLGVLGGRRRGRLLIVALC